MDAATSAAATWPVMPGTYEVGDPSGPVAVCVLTSEPLMAPLAHLAGVAITGKVYTANLGITRIVANVTANPAIRFLLLCGKDSPVFHPGQSLVALAEHGVDGDRRIIGAIGYEPVLPTLAPERVARFRQQMEIVDWIGEEDPARIAPAIGALVARSPGQFAGDAGASDLELPMERFTPIRPGGVREPLQYDPKGYFVITLDRTGEQIVLRHFLPDHTPAHEMRGHAADAMVLGLLREGLVTQLSHAGYMGEELAKAEAALRLGLRYDQDRPLRRMEAPAAATPAAAPTTDDAPAAPSPAPSGMSRITPPATWEEMEAAAPGAEVNATLAVTAMPEPGLLEGDYLAPDEAEPFNVFHQTPHALRVRWSPGVTRVIMGETADVVPGALLRVRGAFAPDRLLEAAALVVLTRVARVE
jgi:tetrahydromethanopterin S-methyltransferase subunit A